MPCFSASNVRFISAQQQLQTQSTMSTKERARTAARTTISHPINHAAYPRFNSSTQRNCMQLLLSKSKNQNYYKQPTRNRTQFLQNIKSRPTTLSFKDLERLQNAAKVITAEERLEALERQEELAKRLDEQAERTKMHFRKIDEKRLQEAENSSISIKEDLSDSVEKQKMLERAFIAQHEQEEEVKAVNRIILNAKCHAVRDAQVQEKHDIERDHRNEEMRLEKMVIEGAAKALAQEDCEAEKQKERKAKYAREIRAQLEQREGLRYMEAERAEEEARVQREANSALKRDEERQVREAWERRQQFRNELNRIVEMSNLFKKMLCEQEREADMRVAAYMREKREREKELQREKQLAKEEFERKQQRMYQLAQKLADSKTHRDEMVYLREQERVEREYRKREMDTAMRKKQLEREIKEARERQLQETKSRQALQIAREEKDFSVLINNLKKEESRLKQQEVERAQQRKCYRAEIIRQMSDKVMARRRLLENERNEANLWREAERQRLINIRTIIGAKLAAMREACLPERYIRDVEKQLERIIKTHPRQVQQTTQVED